MDHINIFKDTTTDPERIANIFKALGHPTRVKIILLIQNNTKCVCEIHPELDIDMSTLSKHLSVLKKAGVVESEKKGLNVYYTLKMRCVINFFKCVY